MKIEKLEVKGFGKLNNLNLELKTGLNIIFGNNESGKSSLQWFIRGMFFGLKGGRSTKDGQLPAGKKFKPWILSDYSGIIEYVLDSGERFRVGRNFSTNSVHVFDAQFNEITNTFDYNKEKGAQFAEKHLGINEVCFEKTVFIKQMEARIDEDGSKELLNRLTNVVQTGFEDISFRKAQDALKEALKNHVGTDKTSTRPLDRLLARIEQLSVQKNELIKKREAMFEIENRLNAAVNIKNKLQNKKQVFSLILDLLDLEKTIVKNVKVKNDLKEIIRSISEEEEELTAATKKIEEFNKTKSIFEGFAAFNSEDIDNIGLLYYELLRIKEIKNKLEAEIRERQAEKEKLEHRLKELKGFESYNDGIEASLNDLNKALERLKLDYEKNNLGILNERIKSVQYKHTRGRVNIISSLIVSIVFLLIGIYKLPLGYVAAGAGTITTIVLFIVSRKVTRELFDLLNQKKVSFISLNSAAEEINKKQEERDRILSSVKAESPEEFMKLKAEYDIRVNQYRNAIGTLRHAESEAKDNSQRINKLDGEIREMLYTAGIIIDEKEPIREEDIKTFSNGVRGYEGAAPVMDYTHQRLQDINKNIAGHYDKVRALSSMEIENLNGIKDYIYRLDEIDNRETEQFIKDASSIKNIIMEKQVTISHTINLDKVLEENDLLNTSTFLEKENIELEAEYNNILLSIRECETLLRSISGDDDEIQCIDEEGRRLEAKKKSTSGY